MGHMPEPVASGQPLRPFQVVGGVLARRSHVRDAKRLEGGDRQDQARQHPQGPRPNPVPQFDPSRHSAPTLAKHPDPGKAPKTLLPGPRRDTGTSNNAWAVSP